jgi:hypothetical protein
MGKNGLLEKFRPNNDKYNQGKGLVYNIIQER